MERLHSILKIRRGTSIPSSYPANSNTLLQCTTTWEEQQKMDALRKVYHRAVQIPLDNVEKIWQELEAFETNLNKITVCIFSI